MTRFFDAVGKVPWSRFEGALLWTAVLAGAIVLPIDAISGVASIFFVIVAVVFWRRRDASGTGVVPLVFACVSVIVLDTAVVVTSSSLGSGVVAAVSYTLYAVLFLGLAAVLWMERSRTGTGQAIPLVVALAALGFAQMAAPTSWHALGEGFVAAAVVAAVVIVVSRAVAPLFAGRAAPAAFVRQAAPLRVESLAFDVDTPGWARGRRIAVQVLACLALLSALGFVRTPDGWKMVGGSAGATVWNASFLGAALRPDGPAVRDDRILAAGGAVPRDGIADSPALTALKRALPGSWDGVRAQNFLALADLWLSIVAAAMLAGSLAGTQGGAAAAVVVALCLTPLLRTIGASAPFDLWPALLLGVAALRRPSPLLFAGALLIGLLNVADGYELAFVALALGLARRVSVREAAGLAAAGVAGSVVAAFAAHALAPDATLFASWWSTDDFRLLASGIGLPWSPALTVVSGAAVLAAWVYCIWAFDRRIFAVAALTALAAVLALPPALGGVPLVVPSRLFDALPIGWPSGRFVELAILCAAFPVALAAAALVRRRLPTLRRPLHRLAEFALVLAAVAVVSPAAPHVLTPALPGGSVAVELPIAESRSPASIMYTDDLLERGARVAEPVPYVSAPALLQPSHRPDFDAVGAVLRAVPSARIVVRDDVYANPIELFAEPTVLDAYDSAMPAYMADSRLSLLTVTEGLRVFGLTGK